MTNNYKGLTNLTAGLGVSLPRRNKRVVQIEKDRRNVLFRGAVPSGTRSSFSSSSAKQVQGLSLPLSSSVMSRGGVRLPELMGTGHGR